VRALLKPDVAKRVTDPDSIKAQDFFAGVDFSMVDQRRIMPPQTPQVLSVGDASAFDEYRPRDCPEDEIDSSGVSFAGF